MAAWYAGGQNASRLAPLILGGVGQTGSQQSPALITIRGASVVKIGL